MKAISRRGVYYDLSQSPHVVINPYNQNKSYTFSSEKKKSMYLNRLDNSLKRTIKKYKNLSPDMQKKIKEVLYDVEYDFMSYK